MKQDWNRSKPSAFKDLWFDEWYPIFTNIGAYMGGSHRAIGTGDSSAQAWHG